MERVYVCARVCAHGCGCAPVCVCACICVCVFQFLVPYQKRQDLEEERKSRDVPGLLACGETEILTFRTKTAAGPGETSTSTSQGLPSGQEAAAFMAISPAPVSLVGL